MSVDSGHRNEPNRGFEKASLKLLRHTVDVTSNEKVFPPKYDKIITLEIIQNAKQIYLDVIESNDIKVKYAGDGEAKHRLELQEDALRVCKDLIRNITLAKVIVHLSTRKSGYWIHLVNDAYEIIDKWHKSDIKRYKSLI